jgi:cell division protein FtsL
VRRRDGAWLHTALLGAWLVLLGSGVGAVYARHEARKLFVELQSLERSRDELNIDWGRLRIEQGMLATHARVERLATEKLGMHLPAASDVSVVRDDETTVASRE